MVLDLSNDSYAAAWLYGFAIDSDSLLPAHRQWLERILNQRVVAGTAGPSPSHPGSSSPWYIWITGAASRTGSRHYNLALSKRRTDAVAALLERRLRSSHVRYSLKPKAIGENFWSLIGRPDAIESRYQRGVLVVARQGSPVEPEIRVPVPKKPHVPVEVRFCLAAERLNFANFNRWNASLFAFARTATQETVRTAQFWWPVRGTGGNVTPTAVVKAPPSVSKDAIFAGYHDRRFHTIYDLDYVGQNFISITTLHYGMTFKIKDATARGDDIAFEFKANVGWELGQTAVAAIGRMQHLSRSQYAAAFPHGLPRWSDADKEWHFLA